VFVLCLQNASAQTFSVLDLGFPNNSTNSAAEAHGLNRNGFVVGTWWDGGSKKGSQYAFLYTNGTMANLGTINAGGNYDYAIANAINNSSQIVGQGTTTGNYVYHAFLYTNGVMLDLDNTGQSWSSANAINQHGQIVGEFTTSLGLIHAFIFTNNSFQDLGTLPGGSYSSAKGINDSGVIVGESSDATGNTYAVVYSNNIPINLGTLGGNYSAAFAINNSGSIVGESTASNGELHAFIYRNGTMSDLGTLGGTNSSAQAINNGGLVTGYALTTNEASHAFLFSGSTMLDLQQASAFPAGWTNVFLTLAYGINDAGQVVGGVNYITNNGATNYDAFLLTPPALSVTCSSNIMVSASGPTGAVVSFTFTATGGCSQATATANPPSGSNFPVGTNTVRVTASDLCGHTNTCSFFVTVNPPGYPPILLVNSTNVTATATSSNGAVVTFSSSASGGCSPPVIVAVPPSGSTFSIGTTTVTNTASDSCGNSTNGTFTVTVKPVPAPLNLTSPAILANGQFTMSIQGAVGQNFVIQASTDLLNWLALQTNTLPATSTNWTDTSAPTNNRRFYRTLTLP
jgi:probable HAF family extracellular repeat protein